MVVPVPVTNPLVTLIVSKIELSESLLTIILPDSASTSSLKVSTIFLSKGTSVSLFTGIELTKFGPIGPPSVIVQLSVEIILALAVKPAELY